MQNNKAKFTGKAELYGRFRPAYPEAMLDWLWQEAGLAAGATVADIGSGTGILARQLLARRLVVCAVEPNADMRAIAEKELGGEPGFISVDGCAEATGLADGSVGLAVAAQAFHWFDADSFRAECRRILTPGAPAALIWNSREPRNAMLHENAELCRKYCPGFYGFSGSGAADRSELFDRFFRDGKWVSRNFDHPLRYDLESFLGRNLSSSYAPGPEDRVRPEFIAALTGLFEKYKDSDGRVGMPNRARCIFGRV